MTEQELFDIADPNSLKSFAKIEVREELKKLVGEQCLVKFLNTELEPAREPARDTKEQLVLF